MELEQIHSPVTNKLLADYWSEHAHIHSFFEYKYNDDSFDDRIAYLKKRTHRSKELSQIIRAYMGQYGISQKAERHLSELEQDAVVVVGGQQAGLLTGPLYSVHKAISVILLAEQQRKKLNTPVVPMFWIAGEDHDIEEINHTFTITNGEVKKRGYSERSKLKKMASTTELNNEALQQFVVNVFKDFGETEHTEGLLKKVLHHAESSKTFTDFFTLLLNDLFENHGLLMLDATFEPFRQYEKSYFAKLIELNEEIAMGVVAQEHKFAQAGYAMPIEATEQNANLFYIKDGERFLLERKDGRFKNGLAHVNFTKEELLLIAEECPECLSNNVVTRPLMQEMALPVLAFVGGPGELAYWATLKPAFETLQLQMPIFAPRLSMTLVTRQVDALLQQKKLTITEVLANKVEQKLAQFMESVKDEQVNQSIEQMQKQLQRQYEQFASYLQRENYHVEELLQKNKNYHERQFDYLQSKLEQQNIEKHEITIRQYKTIQAILYPNGNYQERVYSPYLFLNTYGELLIDDLLALPMSISEQHQLITL
ncbi:bacillithiol biosynthesis cysteine-adding enzyme BshC [Solibacillus silvestris]|uniref:bacillithiol biosynthesis cysteine-adding enzyme BshC n=1 Tax=Solibacillus silvestris TaxID=76853 RepID=UPI003F7F3F93